MVVMVMVTHVKAECVCTLTSQSLLPSLCLCLCLVFLPVPLTPPPLKTKGVLPAVSDEALSLMEGMLTPCPNRRLTTKQVHVKPWGWR